MIGLDGGTFKIIDPLLEQDKLPNLKKLIAGGTRAVLKSTIPPLTAPAWVTLMTGVNPAKHGLFDFRRMEKITYDTPFNLKPNDTCALMHSQYYAGKTIWDIFSAAGLKISVLMMPMTYPAWPVNGYMLSGYPSPDFKKPSGYPAEWANGLGSLFNMSSIHLKNEDGLIKECHGLVSKIGEIFIKQLRDNECDIYSIVFSSTDFLQHYLWRYLLNGESKYSNAIGDMYIEIDKWVGRMMALSDNSNCGFIVLSDHGFTSFPEKFFHTNAWLINEGYLTIKKSGWIRNILHHFLNPLRYQKIALRRILMSFLKYTPAAIKRKISANYYATNQFIWLKTKAFCYNIGLAGGIVINLKGRQPKGIVEKEEYETLRSAIIQKLKGLYDKQTGIKIISEVYRREEIYSGRFIDSAPDIIFMLDSKYKSGIGIDKNSIVAYVPGESMKAISGIHDMDGILILNGPKFKKNAMISPVRMVDIFPTILHDLGITIPTYADGKVIKEAFEKEFVSLPISFKDVDFYAEQVKHDLPKDEEEKMKKSLKGLGYLD